MTSRFRELMVHPATRTLATSNRSRTLAGDETDAKNEV